MMIRSEILGTGMYVPERIMTNDDMSKIMDTSDEWITSRTGIKQRHWVVGNVGASDLGFEAAKIALKNSNVDKSELDMIIFATVTPDHDFPGAACFLQKKLETPGIPAIDVRQQCTGFIYGMSIADQYIRSGSCKKILVVGGEVHSKGLNKTTEGRNVSVLFGDGAGAVVMAAKEVKDPKKDSYIYSTHLFSDGAFAEELWCAYPGTKTTGDRITQEHLDAGQQWVQMNGKTVFQHAVRRMPEAVDFGLKQNGLKPEDVDFFVFHQANMRINDMVAKLFGIPEHKVFNTISRYGNTTAASVPIGLAEAVKAGKLKKGMLVAAGAFGAGFTWSSAIFRW